LEKRRQSGNVEAEVTQSEGKGRVHKDLPQGDESVGRENIDRITFGVEDVPPRDAGLGEQQHPNDPTGNGDDGREYEDYPKLAPQHL
jgi:hypothetical protein